MLLARYSRSEDVVTGTPLANRSRPELEGLQGYLVNTVALRTDMAGAPSFRALLARVRGAVRGALGNADVPFSLVVADAAVPRSASYSPLFQNLCVLQDAAWGDLPALDGTTSQALQARRCRVLGCGVVPSFGSPRVVFVGRALQAMDCVVSRKGCNEAASLTFVQMLIDLFAHVTHWVGCTDAS